MQRLLVGLIVGLQPLLVWPGIYPDASHRLTLVGLCFALGLFGLTQRETRPLPKLWLAWIFATLGVIGWHLSKRGNGLTLFYETALLADGSLLLIAVTFGFSRLRHIPLRWIRWLGVLVLSVNLLAVLLPWSIPSLGLNRTIGAYAAIWAPILWVWQPWLVLLPLSLIVWAGKLTPWLGLAVGFWPFVPHRKLWATGCFVAALVLQRGWLTEKVFQRSSSWHTALQATFEHPLVGWGFSPFTLDKIREQFGYILPTVHCDWLALAIHLGWPLTLAALAIIAHQITRPAPTRIAIGLRAALTAACAMASIQAVLSHARLASVVLVLWAWWTQEQAVDES